MNNRSLNLTAVGWAILLSAAAAQAQSAYFRAITNLGPAGYWPMHESEAAAPGDIETNYGTLGPLGDGYYPDWANGPGNAIQHQVPGAIAGDTDTATYFGTYNGNTFTNELFIPHTAAACTLNPPFSVECWFNTTNASSVGNDIWSQMGNVGLNGGLYNAGGKTAGIRLFVGSGGYTLYTYDPGKNNLLNSTLSAAAPVWCHLVVTCDASTNFSVYVNGVLSKTNAGVGKYMPDYWTPFEVGNGLGNTRTMDASIDELAIYTNVISDIAQHYSDGTNPAPATSYFYDVTNDNPVIYLRMDAPNYSAPPSSTWPALTNYGSVALNGVYSPGTVPGIVSGPVNSAGIPFAGVTNAVPELSGVSSFADAGFADAYNPAGAVPFTVTAMFRGNPTDGRTNSIVGHSDNSWHILLDPYGNLEARLGTAAGSAIVTTNVYNDGNWHQVVDVYTPSSNPNLPGTNTLYVDGVVDTSINTVSTNGITPGTNLDVIIGGDPEYTNPPAPDPFDGVGQQFAGQVCEVALFTNALTATQVRSLYDAAGEAVSPYIVRQPVTSVSGSSAVISVTANGTDPLGYQWYFNAASSYAGASVLTDGDGVSGSQSAGVTITNLENFYFVVVTNSYGAVTSSIVTANFAPAIASQIPTAYTNPFTIFPGFNHTYSVLAVGSSIAFQWYTNGVAVAGATNSSFSETNVQSSFTNYCVVTNTFGAATGYWAAVVIPVPPAPYPQAVTALNPVAYWRLNEADNGGNNDGVVCHDYIGGSDALYTNVNLGNAGYNQTSDPSDTSVLLGNVAPKNSDADWIGTNIDFAVPSGNNAEFSVEAWVCYYLNSAGGLVTKGYGGAEEMSLDSGGPGNSFRFLVRNASGVTNVANCPIVPVADGTTWYHVAGVCDQANGTVSIYVNGVLAGVTNVASGGGIFNDTAWPMTIGSRAASSTSGNTLQTFGFMNDVSVFNYALAPGQIAAEYSANGGAIAPYFNPALTNFVAAISNRTLTVSAAVIGSAPIGFVWTNLNTGLAIAAGATNGDSLDASLVYSGLPASWNGDQLQLTVTNSAGSTNVVVTLSVGGANQSNLENWNAPSGGYTNTAAWLPPILTPGDITNWPDDYNGNGLDYVAILTNNIGSISCLYTNTGVFGTNLIGQLAIGGYGAGLGGGDISNAFIMAGGMLTVTDFTASASAGYAFTVGGTTANAVLSTNYFIMTGGVFNSTNASGGNNWIGYASNTVNEVDFNGGTANLDGLFVGGCGSNTININGGTVNFVPPPGGGGAAGVLNMGWNTNGFGTVNLISGRLNVNCTNNAPSINLGANRGASGVFTFNVSGGTLNAYQIGVGAASGNGTTQVTGAETNVVNVSGGVITLGAGGVTNTIADQHDTNLFIMSGGTFSTLSPANYTPGTTTGNWTMWRGVNAAYILTNQPGPGVVTFAPLSGAMITVAASLTGNGSLDAAGPGTVLLTNVNTYTGGTIVSGGTLALSGAGALASPTIVVAGGATLDVSGLLSPFTLGSGQVLSNSTSTAVINGNVNAGTGTLSLTYGAGTPSVAVANGTLTLASGTVLKVNNTGAALEQGVYTLIGTNAAGVVAGTVPSSVVVTGGGIAGANGSSVVLSSSNTLNLVVGSSVNTMPTNIVISVTNNELRLSWPADHTGWILQAQTNSLAVGISTNWSNVTGSSGTNQMLIPINLTNGSVFYRLIYP